MGNNKGTTLDTLTGEQFKMLIEQLSPDGKIDTIPELIDALDGIPEGMTVVEYIREHGGGTPSPGSVGMVELNDEVKGKLDDVYVQETETLYINGARPNKVNEKQRL